jgi:hypothetical protein
MTMGTPDFNTALQMLADWLVFLEEKKAELRAKIAKSGGAEAASPRAGQRPEPNVPGVDAGGGASGRVLPFSPFDDDAPAELPDAPTANAAWPPPTEPKSEVAQMLDDPLGDDLPISEPDADGDEDDGSPSLSESKSKPYTAQMPDDSLEDDSPSLADSAGRPPGAQSRGASEPDEDEDFRQAMRPGPARPPVITPLKGVLGINQAPDFARQSPGKPPVPALRPSSLREGAADPPVLTVEPATDPLAALDTTWGAEAAPELAKRKRRLVEFTD